MKIWHCYQIKDGQHYDERFYLNPYKAMNDLDKHGHITWYLAADTWWRGAIEREWGTEYYSVRQVHVEE